MKILYLHTLFYLRRGFLGSLCLLCQQASGELVFQARLAVQLALLDFNNLEAPSNVRLAMVSGWELYHTTHKGATLESSGKRPERPVTSLMDWGPNS